MVLLIGFGNPGRGDDGLGPALARRIEQQRLPGVDVRTAFQLTVEHALDVARAEIVVFADADVSLEVPYAFGEVPAKAPTHLDSHTVSPNAVMALAGELFGSRARGFALAIAGAEFGKIKEGLSAPARANLASAETFLLGWIAALPNVDLPTRAKGR